MSYKGETLKNLKMPVESFGVQKTVKRLIISFIYSLWNEIKEEEEL